MRVIVALAGILALVFSITFGSDTFAYETTKEAGKTKLGITVDATAVLRQGRTYATIMGQYNEIWGQYGFTWNDIDWDAIDDFFTAYQNYHGTNIDPQKVVIKIMPWDPKCIDIETNPIVNGVDGKRYICKKEHVADLTNKPVTGENWTAYWKVYTKNRPGEEWKIGNLYAISREFRYGGCIDGVFPGSIVIHLGDDPAVDFVDQYGILRKAWCETALWYEMEHLFLKALGDHCWRDEFSGDCPSHYTAPQTLGLCN